MLRIRFKANYEHMADLLRELFTREGLELDSELAAVQIARADLARKVIKTITEMQIHDQYNRDRQWGYNYGKEKFLAALGELFTKEGVPDRDNDSPDNLQR